VSEIVTTAIACPVTEAEGTAIAGAFATTVAQAESVSERFSNSESSAKQTASGGCFGARRKRCLPL